MKTSQRINFDELKQRASFADVLAFYDLTPSGRGEQTKVHCPFHDDATPSCSVNTVKGVFNCFGCGASGNVLEFVHRMEARNGAVVSLRQAGLKLADICRIDVGVEEAPQRLQNGRKGAGKAKRHETTPKGPDAHSGDPGRPDEGVSGQGEPSVNKPLGFALTLDPAQPYLRERNLSAKLVDVFGLGYCTKGSMAGRVCIPIGNPAGQTVAYAGRWVGKPDELPEGEEKYKLPAGFRKSLELFNLHRVAHVRHLVVVEGYFGAIRLHGERVPAVALMGNTVSERQVSLLLEHCPRLRFVTVMLDGDEPGREAAEKVAARLALHWWVRIAELPDGAQPDTVKAAKLEHLLKRGQQQDG